MCKSKSRAVHRTVYPTPTQTASLPQSDDHHPFSISRSKRDGDAARIFIDRSSSVEHEMKPNSIPERMPHQEIMCAGRGCCDRASESSEAEINRKRLNVRQPAAVLGLAKERVRR